ncbi:MAG: diguanylate cyclase [Proteobacteria bacterium]|nr:diguanylate cyclase [Pseudomonadota bacterium]MBU1387431.1 diguanylate cyclase [Pseudomonadota bacterium]MBU1541716.1 diguanylate cyclase [Pseudomonadota bacterium]
MIKTAIIEDSQALTSVYKTFLKDSEFDVSVFSSTLSDINRLVRENYFKLIVCPCFPKFQTGSQIAQTIKSDPKLFNAVFVVCTSMKQENVKSEWELRDIDAILLKPFDQQRLIQTLVKAYHSRPHLDRKMPIALVIDDSKAVRNTLSSYLEELNFDVKTAGDGMQGLNLASEYHPDLILVDVEMPVMDGFEFCRNLSKDPEIKHIPAIVVSGTIDEVQFRKGFKAGAIDFLEKPVSQHALAAIVESVAIREKTSSSGTTVILTQDNTLCAILRKTLNFLNSSIQVCSTLDELETCLCVSIPDIIILDLSDKEDKLNICMHVRENLKSDSPVIIAIADETDTDIMFQCFRYGATEFIIKPFGRDEVKARIENHIKLKKLQDELVQKNRILESLAYKDKLTGLMNRRYFDKALKDQISKAETNGTSLSFLMIDLDNFKLINDQYGHDIGDMVLKEIAAIIIDNVSSNAIPCRYGGEEFCIIYPETSLVEAIKNSEKIKRFCSGKTISAHKIHQTISGGISSYPETSRPETLVADADVCLYKAKASGKNKIIANLEAI